MSFFVLKTNSILIKAIKQAFSLLAYLQSFFHFSKNLLIIIIDAAKFSPGGYRK